MPAITTPTYWTVADVLALPDDGTRYELAYGRLLVSPSPAYDHQDVVGRLYRAFATYCEEQDIGKAMLSPADLTWGRDDVLVQPDLFVIAREQRHLREWARLTMLPCVVEVLSPSTSHHDRFEKRRVYQDQGVATYWIVDTAHRTVEVWTPDAHFPVIERQAVRWHPAGASAPLVIALDWLFAD